MVLYSYKNMVQDISIFVSSASKDFRYLSLQGMGIIDLLKSMDMSNAALRNNGGGFYNHSLFWSIIGLIWLTKDLCGQKHDLVVWSTKCLFWSKQIFSC